MNSERKSTRWERSVVKAKRTDATYLARALRIAERGIFTTHPNPRVGCVLVKEDRIVGEGYHVKAGDDHAEGAALKVAGHDARGATAYVTLEPCSFAGRTPSCAAALVAAGVSRVVVAMIDPDPRNAGAGLQMLRDAGVEVITPLMEDSARALNPGHVKRYETGLPYIRLKLAMSLDGKTALRNGESHWITGNEARRDVQRLRAASSAIVTGVQTVINDDPMLTVRDDDLGEHSDLASKLDKNVYILDSKGRIPKSAKLVSNSNAVLVSCSPVSINMRTMQVTSGVDERVDLPEFLRCLGREECNEVLFECGATLAGSLVEQRLVDEFIIYIAPTLMGNDAQSLLNLAEIDKMGNLMQLKISDIRMVGDDFRVTAVQLEESEQVK
jgi:diaminohydroxyphosphoribosylaminopyrimidine deaminase/5-amino-6-(5-phosphoribosylamino)uracil reductase